MDKLTRLVGPSHSVIYDVKAANPKQHMFWAVDEVVVVNNNELKKLEAFYELPIHQQIDHVKKTINTYMRENVNLYPQGIFLSNAVKALDVASSLTFSHFCTGLEVRQVIEP